ncbi:MAG: 5'-nucleotidase [Proteobacteria bacterium]|nr:5'-nucleotidase [Pseudomonadota bacterium]
MPRPFGQIHILLSSRVIFDLEEADRIFAEKGAAEYADYMRGRGAYQADYDPATFGRKLAPGPLWNFIMAAQRLNEVDPGTVEIGVMCKDNAETALSIFRNLDIAGLSSAGYRIATAGKPLSVIDLEAFDADLFLSRNPVDVQLAVDHDVAAAVINFPSGAHYDRREGTPLRLWLDGDAVSFGSGAEVVFQADGLEGFMHHEFNQAAEPIGSGPFTHLLAKISQLNARFQDSEKPFELSLLTTRGGEGAARAVATIENLGIEFNGEMYFVCGATKFNVLNAHRPDIFFDDQQVHLREAAAICPTGQVPYKTGSPMYHFVQTHKTEKEKIPAKISLPRA